MLKLKLLSLSLYYRDIFSIL